MTNQDVFWYCTIEVVTDSLAEIVFQILYHVHYIPLLHGIKRGIILRNTKQRVYIPSETPYLQKVNSPSGTPSALRLCRCTCSATAGEAQWMVDPYSLAVGWSMAAYN